MGMAHATTRDDGTEADDSTEEITDYSEDNLHARLAGRLQDLQDATDETDSHFMTVERFGSDNGLVSVTIDTDEFILNEGEAGVDSYHIILGPRGGLRHARHHSIHLGDEEFTKTCDTVSRAWSGLLTSVSKAI